MNARNKVTEREAFFSCSKRIPSLSTRHQHRCINKQN
uniref:Uncharacterized protein n=1 Tax=Rhizophora mucronata TaxID=61149 RepID=A0A2P2K3A7_RHIMU